MKDKEKAEAAAKRAAILLTIAASVETPPAASPVPPATQQTAKQRQRHCTPHEEHLKRAAIEYHYAQYKHLEKDLWGGQNGIVSRVRDAMGLGPDCKHRQCIERTLDAIAAEQGTRARGGGYEGQGHAEMLTRGEALIAAHELRVGRWQTQARHTVNAWRAEKDKGPVSRSAMRIRGVNNGHYVVGVLNSGHYIYVCILTKLDRFRAQKRGVLVRLGEIREAPERENTPFKAYIAYLATVVRPGGSCACGHIHAQTGSRRVVELQ